MIKRIYLSDFIEEFKKYGIFEQMGGYDGLTALYNYIVKYEDDIGEEIELDVIGLYWKFTYYTKNELINYYGYLMDSDNFNFEELIDKLKDYTTVIQTINNNYIIHNF